MRSLRIIIALSVLCFSNASSDFQLFRVPRDDALNSTTTSTPPNDGLVLFVDKFAALVRLANGITLQKNLLEKPEDVYEVTGELLHVNPAWFSDVMTLNLDEILESLHHLHSESVKHPTTSKFEEMSAILGFTNKLIKNFAENGVGFKEESVKEYVDAVNTLKEGIPKFKQLLRTDYLSEAIDCLANKNKTMTNYCRGKFLAFADMISQVRDDFKDLLEYKTTFKTALNVLEKMKLLRESKNAVEGITQLARDLDKVKSLWTFIESEDEQLKMYADALRTANVSRKLVEQLWRLVNYKLRKNQKDPTFTRSLIKNPDGVESIIRDMRDGGFLEKMLAVGEVKNLDKLKATLTPLKLYGKEMVKMDDSFASWHNMPESEELGFENVVALMQLMMQWEELKLASVEPSAISNLKSCFENTPVDSITFNLTSFKREFNYAAKLNSTLSLYFGVVEQIVQLYRPQKLYGFKNLIEELVRRSTTDEDDMWRENDDLSKAVKKNEQLFMNLVDTRTAIYYYEDMLKSKFPKRISKHPNMTEYQETHKQVTGSKFLNIIKCLAKQKNETEHTEKVLNAATALKIFPKFYEEPIRSLMKSISDVRNTSIGTLNYWKFLGKNESRHRRSQNGTIKAYWEVEDFPETLDELLDALETLRNMENAFKHREVLTRVSQYEETSKDRFWDNWEASGRNDTLTTISQLTELDMKIKEDGRVDWERIHAILDKLQKIHGVELNLKDLKTFVNDLKQDGKQSVSDDFKEVGAMKLNFYKSNDRWKLVESSLKHVKSFLEKVLEPDDVIPTVVPLPFVTVTVPPRPIASNSTVTVVVQKPQTSLLYRDVIGKFPLLYLALSVFGAILGTIFLAVIVYSLTPSGRKRWKRYYVSRYASQDVLDLYWRYSFFIDQESEKNSLFEAVREINYDQVKALVKRGVYVNVYNNFGNTPLHTAVSNGHVDLARILIKNGADREAYNAENKTPEMLLTDCIQTTTQTCTETTRTMTETTARTSAGEDQVESLGKMEKMFDKYHKKTFRPRVPDLLPTMAYRIRIDDRVTEHAADDFTRKFRGNVTDQKSGVTHFIVPTGKDGIFESDDFGYIMCVFLPTMLMKSQWMKACLEKKSNLRNDYKFRVEKVKYKGVIYDTVLKWASWVHKQMLPFLYGVQFHVAIQGFGEGESSMLRSLVEMHGAVWCDEMPVKEQYNIGSHPFHHFNLGPLFVIHDGKTKLDHLKNDPDKMYTLLSFDQFIAFMLKLNVIHDPQRKLPIPVSNRVQQEDSTN